MTPQEIRELITWRMLLDAIIATVSIIAGIWFMYGIVHDVFSLIPFAVFMLGMTLLLVLAKDDD
jgi:hypothetical protein